MIVDGVLRVVLGFVLLVLGVLLLFFLRLVVLALVVLRQGSQRNHEQSEHRDERSPGHRLLHGQLLWCFTIHGERREQCSGSTLSRPEQKTPAGVAGSRLGSLWRSWFRPR